MTHISKKQLQEQDLDSLFLQLSKTLAQLNKITSEAFLNEFLGPEEKIMFAKRLAAIVMCIEGNSPYRISELLLMSPSTTERIKLKYEIGGYANLEKIVTKRKKDYEEFWRILEIILRGGMPPRNGSWKSFVGDR